jgi:hypothetical protein
MYASSAATLVHEALASLAQSNREGAHARTVCVCVRNVSQPATQPATQQAHKQARKQESKTARQQDSKTARKQLSSKRAAGGRRSTHCWLIADSNALAASMSMGFCTSSISEPAEKRVSFCECFSPMFVPSLSW